eukprot:5971061-Amphidinium_carterae.1
MRPWSAQPRAQTNPQSPSMGLSGRYVMDTWSQETRWIQAKSVQSSGWLVMIIVTGAARRQICRHGSIRASRFVVVEFMHFVQCMRSGTFGDEEALGVRRSGNYNCKSVLVGLSMIPMISRQLQMDH